VAFGFLEPFLPTSLIGLSNDSLLYSSEPVAFELVREPQQKAPCGSQQRRTSI
jgi:hypothetical protein